MKCLIFIELLTLADNHNNLAQMLFETGSQLFKHFFLKKMKMSAKIGITSTYT